MNAPWRSDLAVALRLARAGGRPGAVRALLTAIGIGLCLLVLLVIMSVRPALDHRGDRTFTPTNGSGPSTFVVHDAGFVADGRAVTGTALAAVSADAPAPPGTSAFPRPGQVWVSPALAAALAGDPTGRLRARLGGEVVGTIADAGLPGPRDLVFYLCVDRLADTGTGAGRGATGWISGPSYPLGSRLTTVLVAGGTVLVVSLLLFVALAGRLGSAARDRRLAALRLLGLGPGRLRRVAAVEVGLAALAGLGLGWTGFLLLRGLAPRLVVDGSGFAPADVWPGAATGAVVSAVVLVVATAPALAGSRRRLVEPLGVVRRPAARPRGAWRLLFVVVAAAVAVLAVRTAGASAWGTYGPTILPAVLLLGAVPVTLPWLVDRVARRWTGGSPAVRLAVGRIRQDPVTAARTAGGLSLALAGAIAMVTLLTVTTTALLPAAVAAAPSVPTAATAVIDQSTAADLTGVAQRLRQVPGVSRLAVFVGRAESSADVHVADCATVRVLTAVDGCADGQVFAVTDTATGEAPPGPGTRLPGGAGLPGAATWVVPDDLVPARSALAVGIWMTPSAFAVHAPAAAAQAQTVRVIADIAPGALAAARDALAPYGWRAAGSFPDLGAPTRGVLGLIVPGLLIGSALCLLIGALGQVVVTAEMLGERRRSLALAVAAGVPRRVLAASHVLAAGLPALVGVVTAGLFGTALANVLLALLPAAPRVDLGHTAVMAAIALAFVLVVAVGTVPMLGRTSRPGGLRTE